MVPGCSLTASFFVAIARDVVNHVDGDGTAPDPLVWSAGALPKRRRLVLAVRDRAVLSGPACIWDGGWITLAASPVAVGDLGAWPHSVGILVMFVAILGTLHWPVAGADLGVGGVSFVEILILYKLWAGERGFSWRRLLPGIGGLDGQFQCRLFHLVQALFLAFVQVHWVRFFELCVLCLVVLAGSSRAMLVVINAGSGTLGGKSAVMVSRLGPGNLPRRVFLNELRVLFRYPPRAAAGRYSASPVLRK